MINSIHRDEETLFDIDHFRSFTGGDRGLEQEILTIFIENAPKYLKNLSKADAGASVGASTGARVGEWRSCAHKLKGAARSIGAWNLACEAERAEGKQFTPGNSADAASQRDSIDELTERLNVLIDHLKSEYLQ